MILSNSIQINSKNLKFAIFYLGLVVILLFFMIFLVYINQENATIIIFSFFYFFVMSLFIIYNYHKGKLIEFTNPVIFYSLLWSIPFSFLPIIISFSENPCEYLPKSCAYKDFIPFAQFLSILSLISMALGFKLYFIVNKNYKIRENLKNINNWSKSGYFIILLLMIFLTILQIIYLIKRDAFILGNTKDLSEHSPLIISYILYIFGYDRISIFYLSGPILISFIFLKKVKSSFIKKILSFLIIINLILAIISAQKERIAITLIIIFIYNYYWRKDRIKFSSELLFLLTVFMFLITFPLIYGYRVTLNLGYNISLIYDFEQIFNIADKLDLDPLSIILNRFDHLNTSLSVIGQTPDFIDYKMGSTYLKGLEAVLLLIPKSKKSEDFGLFNNAFAREYNLVEPFDYYSGITLPQFIEVYMNFGVLLIPIFMFILGYFYAFIFKLIKSESLNLNFLGFLLYYIWVIQFSGVAFSTTVILTIKALMGFFLFYIVLNMNKFIRLLCLKK
jgi:hypothetical protein